MVTDETDVENELTTQQSDAVAEESSTEANATSIGGLSENAAGALAYFFAPILAVIFYLVEEENEFVRFHSVQCLFVFGAMVLFYVSMVVFGIALEMIPVIGLLFTIAMGLFGLLMIPVGFVLWVFLVVKAYRGERYRLPVVGKRAERYV